MAFDRIKSLGLFASYLCTTRFEGGRALFSHLASLVSSVGRERRAYVFFESLYCLTPY